MATRLDHWLAKLGNNRPIGSFSQMIDVCKSVASDMGQKRLILACAEDPKLIEALELARKRGTVKGTLVGDGKLIERAAKQAGVDIANYEVVDAPEYEAALAKSIDLLAEDAGDMLMRGAISAVDFLKAILSRRHEFGATGLMSQVSCVQLPNYHKLLLISDAAVVVAPTMHQKRRLIENAVSVANALGIEMPKVALMAAVEMVNPSMPVSMENAILSKMGERGQIKGALIDGPLALDVATFKSAAELKGVKSQVAGDADILITNKIEEANILFKSLIRFAHAKTGSVIVGSPKPIIITSRVEVHKNELHSIALACLLHSFYNLAADDDS